MACYRKTFISDLLEYSQEKLSKSTHSDKSISKLVSLYSITIFKKILFLMIKFFNNGKCAYNLIMLLVNSKYVISQEKLYFKLLLGEKFKEVLS